MDLNEVTKIGNNVQYNRESVEGRRVSKKSVPTFQSMDVDALDKMVYGDADIPMIPEMKQYDPTRYNANEDMKRMSQDIAAISPERLANSRIPNAIKESIIKNPLNVEPLKDEKMEKFTDGLDRSRGILSKLEEMDAAKHGRVVTESSAQTFQTQQQSYDRPTGVGIDYELIKSIVESVVDRKLKEHGNTLNEAAAHSQSSPLNLMVMRDKFLFLDNDDNVFECKMVYKGKNKAKRK